MPCKLYFEDVRVGDSLPAWTRQTDLMHWNRFAAVNDEFVYIHMDDEAGRNAGNPAGAFGMGNLRWAYLHNLLRDWMGDDGDVREMEVQFRGINQKNDVLTCIGTVTDKRIEGGEGLVTIRLDVVNQASQRTTPGQAVVALPSRERLRASGPG